MKTTPKDYRKILQGMDDLNLLMASDTLGLYDLVRCPEGLAFYWRPNVPAQMAIPVEQEFKQRDYLHPWLHFIRDYHAYCPCPPAEQGTP